MKDNQKFTPKYWVLHHKQNDDVYLYTARKSQSDTLKATEELLGEDWSLLEDNFEIILIEIKKVG